MDSLNKEFTNLIQALNSNDVQYLIVGGLAVNHYGYNRSTGDIDFWLKDDLPNRKNIIQAFIDLEYGNFKELLTTPFLPGFCEIYLDNGIYADLLSEIHGFGQDHFDECYHSAGEVEIQKLKIRFISYQHLVASKSQSDRPKDIQDVLELKKIQDL